MPFNDHNFTQQKRFLNSLQFNASCGSIDQLSLANNLRDIRIKSLQSCLKKENSSRETDKLCNFTIVFIRTTALENSLIWSSLETFHNRIVSLTQPLLKYTQILNLGTLTYACNFHWKLRIDTMKNVNAKFHNSTVIGSRVESNE